MLEGKVLIHHEEPFKVELARGQRGSYGWTITVHAATQDQMIAQLVELDKNLQAQFNHNGEA